MDMLYVIIPAYNEEANIEAVVNEWHDIVYKTGRKSKLVVIDDGSKDNTYKKLCELKKQLPFLEIITRSNRLGWPDIAL